LRHAGRGSSRRARGRDGACALGACDALHTPRALGPFVDVAEDVGGPLAQLVEEGAGPAAVASALAGELRGAPSVLVLEDMHWADAATLDVLRVLVRRLDRLPVLVVATYRDDEALARPLRVALGDLATSRMTRVVLPPLSAAAIERMAGGQAVDAEQLRERTGGNPFYVSEVLAAGGDAIPETVRDAVLARVERLDEPPRTLLEAVAIEPSRMELALHPRALVALTADGAPAPDLARLAHHAEAADDRDAVLRYAPAAAERAGALSAHTEAADPLARALRHADGLDAQRHLELLERRSYECYLVERLDEAIACRRAALSCTASAATGCARATRIAGCRAWAGSPATTRRRPPRRPAPSSCSSSCRPAGSWGWPTATGRSCACCPPTWRARSAGASRRSRWPRRSTSPRSSSTG
jgi:hypothetical protein